MRGIDSALVGRLGRDAERRETRGGQPMAVLNVAVDEGDAEAGPAATTWARVLVFGDQAEAAVGLHKGAEVDVEGRLKLEHWTDKEGTPRSGLTVLARTVQPLGRIGRRRPARPRESQSGDAYRGLQSPVRHRGALQRPLLRRHGPSRATDPDGHDVAPFNDPLPF